MATGIEYCIEIFRRHVSQFSCMRKCFFRCIRLS